MTLLPAEVIYHVESEGAVGTVWFPFTPDSRASTPAIRTGQQPVASVVRPEERNLDSELLQFWRSPRIQGSVPVGAVCLLVLPLKPKAPGRQDLVLQPN